MNKEKSIEVLIQAVQIAQARGAYKIEESAVLNDALKAFTSVEPVEPIKKEEVKEEETKEESNGNEGK